MFSESLNLTMDRWKASILQSLSPVPKIFLEGQDSTEDNSFPHQSIIWVPKRSSLKHNTFPLPSELSERRREAALSLKVSAWAPFEQTGFLHFWSDNVATVLAWDESRVRQKIVDQGLDPSRCEIVPELFLKQRGHDQTRLIKCIDGFEAQVWKDGMLFESRWWPSSPKTADWQLFIRSAGLDASIQIPSPEIQELLPTPWAGRAIRTDIIWQLLNNDQAKVFIAVILLAPIVFLATQYTVFSTKHWLAEREIEKIESVSQTIRAQRLTAITSLENAEDLLSLFDSPHQLEILSRAHQLLADRDITLTNWNYDNEALEFALELDTTSDPTVFISTFEDDPMFSEVSASTRGNNLIVRMNIEGK